MIRVDPRQFDMFAALTPAPRPNSVIYRQGWEAVAIDEGQQPSVAKVEKSYSAMSLGTSGKVMRPFAFRGSEWINTGGSFFKGKADYECYRIMPLEAFDGPGEPNTYRNHHFHGPERDRFGGYHGMQAKRGAQDVVLVGPPIVFVSGDGTA